MPTRTETFIISFCVILVLIFIYMTMLAPAVTAETPIINETPTSTITPTYQAPTSTITPTYQAPTYQAPTSTITPTYQAPTSTITPTYQAPTSTITPTYQAPTSTITPTYQAPTSTVTPTYQAPTSTITPTYQAPTSTGTVSGDPIIPITIAPTTAQVIAPTPTPVMIIPETKPVYNWESRGCFMDTRVRAIPNLLSGSDLESCKASAVAGGYNTFGLQNGNECWAGNDSNYAEYGATTCGDLGGAWKNNVYALSNVPIKLPPSPTWESRGCFMDTADRAIPNRLADSDYKTCKANAIAGGYNTFAMQNGNACFAGNDSNYAKYGATTCGDLGGAWKNNVYALSNVPIRLPPPPTWESRGCFMDTADRAIPNRTSATDYKTCKADAIAGGYNIFALQNGNACFVGKDSNYAKYGATTCGDLGGAWKNNVYALSNVPIFSQSSNWCKNGIYSNGVPIPESEAQVGATVCGGNNIKYTCKTNGTTPYWSKLGSACEVGMKGRV
jgi:hypothetical protein